MPNLIAVEIMFFREIVSLDIPLYREDVMSVQLYVICGINGLIFSMIIIDDYLSLWFWYTEDVMSNFKIILN